MTIGWELMQGVKTGGWNYPIKKISMFKMPSKVNYTADLRYVNDSGFLNYSYGSFQSGEGWFMDKRHTGGFNMQFTDGSAVYFPYREAGFVTCQSLKNYCLSYPASEWRMLGILN